MLGTIWQVSSLAVLALCPTRMASVRPSNTIDEDGPSWVSADNSTYKVRDMIWNLAMLLQRIARSFQACVSDGNLEPTT